MMYLCVMEEDQELINTQENPMIPTGLVDDVKLIVERGLREAYRSVTLFPL